MVIEGDTRSLDHGSYRVLGFKVLGVFGFRV